jgi:hypothetical protein
MVEMTRSFLKRRGKEGCLGSDSVREPVTEKHL